MQQRMSLSKYESTQGTTHLARIARAILGPCIDVMREVLTKEISPHDLEKKVKTYILQKRKPPISKQQAQFVYSKKYTDFDITLLYFLLRNMCSIPPHINNWGNSPDSSDKSVSANIERIRILRNEWYGHATDISLSDSDFKRKWNHISQIVKELEGYLGTATKYQDSLIELKTCCMDPDSEQSYINKLSAVEELKTDVTNLKEDVKKIEKSINTSSKKELIEEAIFEQWKQDDSCFIATKACEEVEKIIKSRNLVIVSGHSGSGKSAIIQHIALKYREQGWTVKRVKNIEEIKDEYSSSQSKEGKTICVFNDPLGKEYFDEILNNSWQTNEEELKVYLKTAKLVMSCRSYFINDARLTRFLANQSHIVNIDDNKNKLSVKEKRQILNKYTSKMNLSDEDCNVIVGIDKYFPLLCKLYSSNKDYKNMGTSFFTEPVLVLKEEIIAFRNKNKDKYCALALLVLFNDDLCVSDLLKNKDTEYKFKRTLKLCGLPENTPPSTIGDNLNSVKDCFVKSIDNTFHFCHDLVMEVTSHVFGKDYPAETVKYADIGFLRRRVKLGEVNEDDNQFTIYLADKYTEELGERLYTELFGERILDVVLNPCLRNEKVIKVLKKKIGDRPQLLLQTKKLTTDKQQLDWTSKGVLLSKLRFLKLDNEVSPLFVLTVFCHTQLSQYCVYTLQQKQIDSLSCSLISAICCNGSIELFNIYKDRAEAFLKKTWEGLYPIHIVSAFHNNELFNELIKIGACVNQKTNIYGWTPLMLATANETFNNCESGEKRRDSTVQLLLKNGADINLCREDGASPLYIASQNGHDSTVQILLRNGAEVNLCTKEGESPLYIASQNGYDSVVHHLLSKGANINLFDQNRVSPLLVACYNEHENIVKLLLSKGADIDLCKENGVSPLLVACYIEHENIVKLLLSNGADINLCLKDGASPLYLACFRGHDNIVHLLLSKGSEVNLCTKAGKSPLCKACQNGHDSVVQHLLSNGAEINLCNKNGVGPLYIACENGHDSTVQLLLSNGAEINLCSKDRVSPLIIAFEERHYRTVNVLLDNGVDTSLDCGLEVNPDLTDCFDKQDCTAEFLQQKDSISNNIYDVDSYFSLFVSCQVERVTRIMFEEQV